jgi:hypothetical protein
MISYASTTAIQGHTKLPSKTYNRSKEQHSDDTHKQINIDKECALYVQKLGHDLGEDIYPLTPSLKKLDTALAEQSLQLDKDTLLQALDDIEHLVKKHHEKLDENCTDEFKAIKEKQIDACSKTHELPHRSLKNKELSRLFVAHSITAGTSVSSYGNVIAQNKIVGNRGAVFNGQTSHNGPATFNSSARFAQPVVMNKDLRVNGNIITNQSIEATDIADGGITSNKIAENAVGFRELDNEIYSQSGGGNTLVQRDNGNISTDGDISAVNGNIRFNSNIQKSNNNQFETFIHTPGNNGNIGVGFNTLTSNDGRENTAI